MATQSNNAPWFVAAISVVLAAGVWLNLRSQIEKKDEEIATLKAKIESVVSEANSKLSDANAKYRQLAEEANQRLRVANEREVQVRIGFRKAFLSSGNVASIGNTSGQTIAVEVEVERPSSSQRRSFSLTLDPGQTKEVGEQEGWAFIPQDIITVSQAEHKTLRFIAP